MQLSREHLSALTTATYEQTVATLREGPGAATAAALCRRLNGVIDAELGALQATGAGVACAVGCNFCCHLRVGVFRHEASALLLELRTRIPAAVAAGIEQRIHANARRIDALTPEQHRTAGLKCAFLVDGRCSAHSVRPSSCAAYHSLSRERCERSFRDPTHVGTPRNARPALLELQVLGTALIEATRSACAAAGAPDEQVELHQAMRALLTAA